MQLKTQNLMFRENKSKAMIRSLMSLDTNQQSYILKLEASLIHLTSITSVIHKHGNNTARKELLNFTEKRYLNMLLVVIRTLL